MNLSNVQLVLQVVAFESKEINLSTFVINKVFSSLNLKEVSPARHRWYLPLISIAQRYAGIFLQFTSLKPKIQLSCVCHNCELNHAQDMNNNDVCVGFYSLIGLSRAANEILEI